MTPDAAIHAALQAAVARRATAGAVCLLADRASVQVVTSGVQDLATGVPMQRNTIFRIASMTKPVTAAAALLLVQEGRIGLHDPVEKWLPELANRRVLRSLGSALDDTVPAQRAITLDDLLTLRLGVGAIMAPPGTYPVQAAMQALGVAPSPQEVDLTPDAFMAHIGQLPLFHQPGAGWMYHTGAEILAVLIARVSGIALGDFLAERIFTPLGMVDTGFSVPAPAIGRLATSYAQGPDGTLAVWDKAEGGAYAKPPVFPSELVATVDDYLHFARMLLGHGSPVLTADNRRLMMTDHITPAQKAVSPFFPGFWDHNGWGYGGAVTTHAAPGGPPPGSYGWSGGFGTSMLIDPSAGRVIVVMIQRVVRGPDDFALTDTVQRLAYQPHTA